MREKIERKIDEVIEFILAKDPKEITYSEYRIIDSRAKDLRYLEEQKQRTEEMTNMMIKTLGFSSCLGINAPLPEPTIKEE